MSETEAAVRQLLVNGGYAIGELYAGDRLVVIFENATVFGFIFLYDDYTELLDNWQVDSERTLRETQFRLRQAGEKAWNTYTVFLSDNPSMQDVGVHLQRIEENLVGTRKIARTGVRNADELRLALLPLLGIQNAPKLEPIDMAHEIRLRTSELPVDLVDGFIADAPKSIMTQLLESGQ